MDLRDIRYICNGYLNNAIQYTIDLENFGVKKLRKAHTSKKIKTRDFLL